MVTPKHINVQVQVQVQVHYLQESIGRWKAATPPLLVFPVCGANLGNIFYLLSILNSVKHI